MSQQTSLRFDLEYVADDLHVLQDVMRCVQEETGGHTIKAGGLVLCAVHLHKVPGTHGQQAWPLN